jgi:hypothetical protein
MEQEKKILLASTQIWLISELPYLFKKAGFRVYVISIPHWTLSHSSYIDHYIETPDNSKQIVDIVAKKVQEEQFDLIMLASDDLLWELNQSSLDEELKKRLSPVGNWKHKNILGGKIPVMEYCQSVGIKVPSFRLVKNQIEAKNEASSIGWPVMIKDSQSSGGGSVWKCNTDEDVEKVPFSNVPFLMEKFIEGKTLCIEPLFLKGALVAYNFSTIIPVHDNPFMASIERVCEPNPAIEPFLVSLGRDLKITSFLNITLIEEKRTGEKYLVEIDFRPTRWIRVAELVGVNWSFAIKNPNPYSPERPKKRKQLRLFPAFPKYAINTKNYRLFFSWLWGFPFHYKTLPLYDLKMMWAGIRRFFFKCLKNLSKN